MKTPKLLIVEDININLMIYKMFLNRYGIDILTATDGLEGLQTVRDNSDIDLIIMNYQMPVMNGMESIIEIRKFNKEIPIIMTSALFGFSDTIENALKSGANDCLSLPIKNTEFIEKIEKCLGYKLIEK
jgi:CheY-like chemotaxis protein